MVKFVRLACLMCAASVYPEPGSNSQYNFEFFQALFINFNFLIFFDLLFGTSLFLKNTVWFFL